MKTKISLLLRIAVAIIFLQTLYFKFSAHPDSVYIFSQLGAEPVGRITLGFIEMICAVLILVPATKNVGIIISTGIILGAVASHLGPLGIVVQNDGGKVFFLALAILIACSVLIAIHFKEIIAMVPFLKSKTA
jgi:putative oxidoreductase